MLQTECGVCVCVHVCVFTVCRHMIESLLKYLDSVCSCGTIYHVSRLAGWGRHISFLPPFRMWHWANCPNIQDLWGVKHPIALQHITYARQTAEVQCRHFSCICCWEDVWLCGSNIERKQLKVQHINLSLLVEPSCGIPNKDLKKKMDDSSKVRADLLSLK